MSDSIVRKSAMESKSEPNFRRGKITFNIANFNVKYDEPATTANSVCNR